MTQPRIAIIGAGSIGTFVALSLVEAGQDVVVCARKPLQEISVERDCRRTAVAVRAITDPADAPTADWIVLATKAQDTPGTAPWLRALAHPGSTVVVLQNGIGHVE